MSTDYLVRVTFTTTAPGYGKAEYVYPVRTWSPLLGTVRAVLATRLDVPEPGLSLSRIEIVEFPEEAVEYAPAPAMTVQQTADFPPSVISLDAPTVTVAPGIYTRPVVTASGYSTSYTVRWARVEGGTFAYQITRKDDLASETAYVVQDATFGQVKTWLRWKGFKLAD